MLKRTMSLAAACLLALGAPAQAQTRIVANCFFPPQHFVCAEVLAGWAEDVARVTEGRVRVTTPARSMAPPPEQLASVRGGVFDAGFQFNGFIADEIVGPAVSLQPFTATGDARANSVALWRTYETYLADADEFSGVQLLGLFVAPGVDLYAMQEPPITSLEDLQRRRMWAAPGVTARILRDIGSPVVSGPAVQMTELIQRGVVDGYVGIPASDAVAFNVLPYARSATRTQAKISAPSFSFFVSQAVWERIVESDRAAILSVSGEAFAERAGLAWAGAESRALISMSEALSVPVIDASEEFEAALRAAAEPFAEEWIAAANARGIDAAAALEFYRSTAQSLAEY